MLVNLLFIITSVLGLGYVIGLGVRTSILEAEIRRLREDVYNEAVRDVVKSSGHGLRIPEISDIEN